MTDNNIDEFENNDFAPDDGPNGKRDVKKNLVEAWRTNPLFKLIIIMIVVGTAIAGALGAFSGGPTPDKSRLVSAPELNEPPGGKTSPSFIEQNKMANEQRAREALQSGNSSLPTPVGPPTDFEQPATKDPLVEFRAETERLKKELQQQQQQTDQKIVAIQQQRNPIQSQPANDDLAKAMQKQMQQLMESWVPKNMKLVSGVTPLKETSTEKAEKALLAEEIKANQTTPIIEDKNLVQAGSVNYAQLLTEANSDVPSPILAQILSGPLSGGRAIGHFKVSYDYLVIEFNLVNHKGKDYAVNALALDPDTTLAGMATEVDHRYFSRVLLPAAGSFVAAFGQTMSQPAQTVTSTDTTTTITQSKQGIEDATYAGIGQAGQTISQFLKSEGNRIQPLVRVAVGTPMGIFFLTPVKESGKTTKEDFTSTPPGYRAGGNGQVNYNTNDQGGYSGSSPYNNTQPYENQPPSGYQRSSGMVVTPFPAQTNLNSRY